MSKYTIVDHSFLDGIQPKDVTLTMKLHQLKMFRHCLNLESGKLDYTTPFIKGKYEIDFSKSKLKISTKLGVIGNSVGSGKSLIIMALMSSKYTHKDEICISNTKINRDYKMNNDIMQVFADVSDYEIKDTNVLVVPHTIFEQWSTYLKTQSTLSVEYIKTMHTMKSVKFDKNVILVSAKIYNEFAAIVNKQNYLLSRIIYDEADSIDISNCIEVKYGFCWFVTSSLNNLLYPKGMYGYVYNSDVHVTKETYVDSKGIPVFMHADNNYYHNDGSLVNEVIQSKVIDVLEHRHNIYDQRFPRTEHDKYKYTLTFKGIKKKGFIRDVCYKLSDCPFSNHVILKK
jgi:hypothetical protein